MNHSSIIVVTGAAGFIGSCFTGFLNEKGYHQLILVDEFSRQDKLNNLKGKKFIHQIERDDFFSWLKTNNPDIQFVFHLGARTDTTEFDYAVHERLNLEYSQSVWDYCMLNKSPWYMLLRQLPMGLAIWDTGMIMNCLSGWNR